MNQLKELEDTFVEQFEAAQILKEHQKPKSITVLLSKSLFALADYIIFKELEKLPQNHSERFRILEIKFPEVYFVLDGIWSRYTDAYNKAVQKEGIQMLEGAINEIITKTETISQRIKEVVEK